MNRRTFLMGGVAAAAFLPQVNATALDVDVIASPVMEVLQNLPHRPGPNGDDFALTTGANNRLARNVITNEPDMYWDPMGEDYYTIFGLYDTWIELSGGQDGVSLWFMADGAYARELSTETLQSNGWEIVDEDLGLMHYQGTQDERSKLAASLEILGRRIKDGEWDWVATPDDRAVVVGPEKDLVRTVADRLKNHTAMLTADQGFPGLRYILRPDTFEMSLIPRQSLKVEHIETSFISQSWTGDKPVIQSIGLQLESRDLIEEMHTTVTRRLESETSALNGLRYADFLSIDGTQTHGRSYRIDFIDSTGEYDLGTAYSAGDLRMLPLINEGM